MDSSRNNDEASGDPRRHIASVSQLLEDDRVRDLVETYGRACVVEVIQEIQHELRRSLLPGDSAPSDGEIIEAAEGRLVEQELDRIRPVVNASGVILHTGLGRAVLPKAVAAALGGMDHCCNLQMDLRTGTRGKRNFQTERLLCRLTGAEAALVVNNNAAATLLILTALCADREVIVSRGQLIEIGGSYRLPDCVHQSGATLVEVGTTNKTHLRDYEAALSENTGAVLRVNPSNYRVIGFSKQVPVADLVSLKREHSVFVIDDLGCGALLDMREFGLPREPTAPESIAAGADLVCFSGDKMIGGPQAGIIVGRENLVEKIRRHPLTRMLRVGKLTDAALEHTLRLFLHPERLAETHPTFRMLVSPLTVLEERARELRARIENETCAAVSCRVIESQSAVGGGSLPGSPMDTFAVAVRAADLSADRLAGMLRCGQPPVIARIHEGEVLLDVRTLLPGDDQHIVDSLQAVA